MVTKNLVVEFARKEFDEVDVDDRITESDFAFYLNTQPRKYIDSGDFRDSLVGGGPIVILKKSGELFRFSSSPIHMAVYSAKSLEEFSSNIKDLERPISSSSIHTEHR